MSPLGPTQQKVLEVLKAYPLGLTVREVTHYARLYSTDQARAALRRLEVRGYVAHSLLDGQRKWFVLFVWRGP